MTTDLETSKPRIPADQLQPVVWKVCDELWAEGDPPSIPKIQAVIGKGNSPNTISKFLKLWREQNLGQGRATEAEPVVEEGVGGDPTAGYVELARTVGDRTQHLLTVMQGSFKNDLDRMDKRVEGVREEAKTEAGRAIEAAKQTRDEMRSDVQRAMDQAERVRSDLMQEIRTQREQLDRQRRTIGRLAVVSSVAMVLVVSIAVVGYHVLTRGEGGRPLVSPVVSPVAQPTIISPTAPPSPTLPTTTPVPAPTAPAQATDPATGTTAEKAHEPQSSSPVASPAKAP